MGITTRQLRKLGFKEYNKVFPLSEDKDTLAYYIVSKNIVVYLPKNKTLLFVGKNVDPGNGNVENLSRFVFLDDIGYFELQSFLKSIKRDEVPISPRKVILD